MTTWQGAPAPDSQEELKRWRESEIQAERHNNVWRTEHYFLPLLDRLFRGRPRAGVRVLSVGCGNGEDVDTIIEQGYQAVGIEIGYRSQEWTGRVHRDRFLLASGEELPFADQSFDLVLHIGVLEHIGATVGESLEMLPDYQVHRRRFADELVRVLKPGGVLLAATPNKRFPFDLWHGPFIFGLRPHLLTEKFLMSYGEIRDLFCRPGLCRETELLGLEDFFQFKKTSQHLWIQALLPLIRAGVRFISSTPALRVSFLNPFLIVLSRKPPVSEVRT